MIAFTLTDDVIDSRTIQERIEELENAFDPEGPTDDFGPDEHNELGNLTQFRFEIGDCDEWNDGITFVNEEYFTEYAKEFVNDVYYESIGTMTNGLPDWLRPHVTIDWDGIAHDMKSDYTTVDFMGITYYYIP